MKHNLRLLTMLVMVGFYMFSTTKAYAQTATAPSVGDGTEENPYEIASLENLIWMSQNYAECSKNFIQTADIDATETKNMNDGAGFTPIMFKGSYDGQFHTIDSIYINRSNTEEVGLFGSVYGSSSAIRNLGVTNANVTGKGYVGCLIGNLNEGSVENCYSTGNVSCTIDHVGGLIGQLISDAFASKCFSTANVTAGNSSAGGLIGILNLGSTLSESYSKGNVSSSGGAGGLIGFCFRSSMQNCYSTSLVDAMMPAGLIGLGGSVSSTGCFWNTETSGCDNDFYGIGLTTAEMKQQSIFIDAGWDFVGEINNGEEFIWNMNSGSNEGYPYLNWQGTQFQELLVFIDQKISSVSTNSTNYFSNIIIAENIELTDHGVCWSESANPIISENHISLGGISENVLIDTIISGLSAFTNYNVRAYAIVEGNVIYGDELSFTTLQEPIIFDSPQVIDISDNSAQYNVSLEIADYAELSDHGVCWGAYVNPTLSGDHISFGNISENAIIDTLITNLNSLTDYYVRPYAIFEGDVIYGDELNFTTLQEPVLFNNPELIDITDSSVQYNVSVELADYAEVSDHGVCWSESVNPTLSGNHTSLGSISESVLIETLIDNLDSRTEYHVRPYAIENGNIIYGDELTFTTLQVPVSFDNAELIDINDNSAQYNVSLEIADYAEISDHGVCWGKFVNPTLSGEHISLGGISESGVIEASIENLISSTEYYIRPYAIENGNIIYGDELSFITLTEPVTFNNPELIDISDNSVQYNASIQLEAHADVSDHGVCWDESYSPTISDSHISLGSISESGLIEVLINNLNSNTRYYIRPFAINNGNIKYGRQLIFTTLISSEQPSGNGTEDNPYQIASLENLLWLSENSSEWNKHYIQLADIDASPTRYLHNGKGFSPIGNVYHPFSGTYKGNAHIISRLYINRPKTENIGLFGYTYGREAKVEMLGIEDANITGGDNTGVLTGYNNGGRLQNAYVSGRILSKYNAIGGFVGFNKGYINNSYADVNVSGRSKIGGFIGNNVNSGVSYCYSIGNVIGEEETGGFIGNNEYGRIRSCFYDIKASGQTTSDGGRGLDVMNTASIYKTLLIARWDFVFETGNGSNDYWIKDNEKPEYFPVLFWQLLVSGPFTSELRTKSEAKENSVFTTENLKVYPNPVKDKLTIQTDSENSYNVEIYDITGKLKLSNTYNSQIFSIDLTNIKTGIYILSVSSGDQKVTKKIMKQ